MKHSAMYEKINGWYKSGFWTKAMVKNAGKKGKIAAEEYKEIVEEE